MGGVLASPVVLEVAEGTVCSLGLELCFGDHVFLSQEEPLC